MEKLTRRGFLKFTAGVGVGLLADRLLPQRLDLPQPQPLDVLSYYNKEGKLLPPTKGEAVSFALRLSDLEEKIVPFTPEPPDTIEEVRTMALEILPYFFYEKIYQGEQSQIFFLKEDYIKPLEIVQEEYRGYRNFHVLGSAECFKKDKGELFLNSRFFNPYSPWFRKSSVISTLVHELAHFQEICQPDELTETATQLATVEVLAAMTRHGNKYTFLPFLDEVQGFAESFALFQALKEGNLDWYKRQYLARLPNPDWRMARFEKSMDFWRGRGIGNLIEILEKYGSVPYILLREAMNDEYALTGALPISNVNKRIEMNDTKYVLGHANQLVEGFKNL